MQSKVSIEGDIGARNDKCIFQITNIVGGYINSITGRNKEKLFKNILAKIPEAFLVNLHRIMGKIATPEVTYGLQDLREELLARKDASAMAEMKRSLKGTEARSAEDEEEKSPTTSLNEEILSRLTQMGTKLV